MTRPVVLALSSGGGHWVQLLRLRPALEGFETVYASVNPGQSASVSGHRYFVVADSNRDMKLRVLATAWSVLVLLLRLRPRVVMTTGAAPGYFAVAFGKLLGARTIWVDSIANAGELSLSGRKAARYTDLYLTQWPELAREDGPRYVGNVL